MWHIDMLFRFGKLIFPISLISFAFPMTTELSETTTAKQNMSTKRQEMVILHISSIDYCYWFFQCLEILNSIELFSIDEHILQIMDLKNSILLLFFSVR